MIKREMRFLAVLLCCMIPGLAGCGAEETAPTTTPIVPLTSGTADAEETPDAEAEPVTELCLTDESAGEILALRENTELQFVDARDSREYEALFSLQAALPDCVIEWVYPLCGREVGSLETELVFEAEDAVNAEELMEGLQYLPRLTQVDLCAHEMREADMAKLTEAYPDVFFVWNVSFAAWTVRSDITVFSTLQPGETALRWDDEDLAPLFRYCTRLRALDLGHNDLRDLEAFTRLTDLEVLILIDSPNLADASPLGELEKLEYLEFYLNPSVRDYSFLAEFTNMKYVNLSYAPVTELSFLDTMPELRMAWLGFCPLSAEEVQRVRDTHPEAEIRTWYDGEISSTAAGWRASDYNVAVRKAFKNWEQVEYYGAWDDVRYREGAQLIEMYPTYEA
ncbi:MAG: leucine-rich repeat domain-containing protein [Eubacteriales bacterium]|nr:leucine-rich repeat domain-containing protein [Eubacteriales bacterium]